MPKVDIELALTRALPNQLSEIRELLPSGFMVEDESKRGWGLVIRNSVESYSDFDSSINGLLSPLAQFAEKFVDLSGIIRVAVFYTTASCTININSFGKLSIFSIPCEITTYPCAE